MESADGRSGAQGAARRDELGGLCSFYRGRRKGKNGLLGAASLGEPCGTSSCPERGRAGRRGCPGALSGSELRRSPREGEKGLTPLSPPHAAGAPRDSLSPVEPTSGTPRCPRPLSPPAPLPPPGIASPSSRDTGASHDTGVSVT